MALSRVREKAHARFGRKSGVGMNDESMSKRK